MHATFAYFWQWSNSCSQTLEIGSACKWEDLRREHCWFFFFFSFFILFLFVFHFFAWKMAIEGKILSIHTFPVSWKHLAFLHLLIKRWTRDRKVVSLNPSRSGRKIFFSRVKFVCWISFSARSTPLLLQRHVKYPGHSAKSAGGRLHLNTHSLLTRRSRNGLTMPLSWQSVGIYQEMSSHATRQGTLGHSHLSSLSHFGLILA